jgi:predicted ATP-grasp superfamily ATP-dependent carboligase
MDCRYDAFLDSAEEICLNLEKRIEKLDTFKRTKICKVIEVFGMYTLENQIQDLLDEGYNIEHMKINEIDSHSHQVRLIATLILNKNSF